MAGFDEGILESIKGAVSEAISEGAHDIAEESKRQAPEDTGALRKSCRMEMTGEMEAEVTFAADYAAKVHEGVNARHRAGKAKFLEDPFNDMAGRITEAAAKKINEIISR